MAENPRVPTQGNILLQYLASISVSVAYMSFGNHIGWCSSAIPKFKNRKKRPYIEDSYVPWIVSALQVTQLISILPASFLADKFGRKPILFLSFVPLTICWLFLVIYRDIVGIFICRFIAGIGCGIIVTVGPVYMSEIAHQKIRGRMGVLFLLMFNYGILHQHLIETYVKQFNLVILLSTCVPLIFTVIFSYMPETPIYLIRNDRIAARKVLITLRKTRDDHAINSEMDLINRSFLRDTPISKLHIPCEIAAWKPLSFGLALVFFHQMSGIVGVLNYSWKISQSGRLGTIANGSARLTVCFFVPVLTDLWGRRPLLILSYGLSFISLFTAAWLFYISPKPTWITDIPIITFLMAQILGAGTLPMTVAAELMPSDLRAKAVAISQLVMCSTGLISSFSFLYMLNSLGPALLFWLCSLDCLFGLLFVIIFLPETKGKTFVEIQNDLKKPVFNWNKRKDRRSNVTDEI